MLGAKMNKIEKVLQKEQILLKVTGENVENGTMSIDDYVDYLKGVSELLQTTNTFLNTGLNLEVKIHSSVTKGSIENTLELLVSGSALFSQLSQSYSINDMLSILGLTRDGVMGLIQLLNLQKKRKVKIITELSEDKCRLEFEGENCSEQTAVEISKKLFNVWRNRSIRQSVYKSMKILNKPGYEKIGFKDPKTKDYDYIDRSEVGNYDYNFTDESYVGGRIYTSTVYFESIPIGRLTNKWTLKEHDGEQFNAHIRDEKFLNQVKTNGVTPPFSAKVRIKETCEKNIDGVEISKTRDIAEVLEIGCEPEQGTVI